MDHILQKEIVYRAQMADVRETVLRFIEPKGWATQSRGRRAHVSVYGPVSGLDGVIDIEMEETDWDKMPESLQPNTPFWLWCSASLDRDGLRLSCDTELFWRAPFVSLVETVDEFLPRAWDMLTNLNQANLLREWPGSAKNPDGPPDFGPPRRRRTPR
jgi:hypothetical protein